MKIATAPRRNSLRSLVRQQNWMDWLHLALPRMSRVGLADSEADSPRLAQPQGAEERMRSWPALSAIGRIPPSASKLHRLAPYFAEMDRRATRPIAMAPIVRRRSALALPAQRLVALSSQPTMAMPRSAELKNVHRQQRYSRLRMATEKLTCRDAVLRRCWLRRSPRPAPCRRIYAGTDRSTPVAIRTRNDHSTRRTERRWYER